MDALDRGGQILRARRSRDEPVDTILDELDRRVVRGIHDHARWGRTPGTGPGSAGGPVR